MLKYYISLFCIVTSLWGFAQQKQDTTAVKLKYGLRLGVNLFNSLQKAVNADKNAFEIVADYRLKQNLYIATELGTDDNLTRLDYVHFTTKGNYIKVGIDYSTYKNWKGMDNLIYFGARLGYSNFSHTILNYTVNSSSFFTATTNTTPIKFDNLTGKWFEIVFGLKAETFNNLFLGFSFRSKFLISATEPTNFKNLYIPGFNRVFLNNSGFGFNYTLSYLIPFKKK